MDPLKFSQDISSYHWKQDMTDELNQINRANTWSLLNPQGLVEGSALIGIQALRRPQYHQDAIDQSYRNGTHESSIHGTSRTSRQGSTIQERNSQPACMLQEQTRENQGSTLSCLSMPVPLHSLFFYQIQSSCYRIHTLCAAHVKISAQQNPQFKLVNIFRMQHTPKKHKHFFIPSNFIYSFKPCLTYQNSLPRSLRKFKKNDQEDIISHNS